MARSINDMIIEGLGGQPITDLVEGWSIRIEEVAPYVFRVQGKNNNGRIVRGFGGSAEEALDDCVKKVKRITLLREQLSRLKDKIRKIFRFRK